SLATIKLHRLIYECLYPLDMHLRLRDRRRIQNAPDVWPASYHNCPDPLIGGVMRALVGEGVVDQPHFLFIVTPPFSGSTALAELLHSSPAVGFLQERAEGQWLVPGLCADARWDPTLPVDYAAVQAVWLQRWQQLRQVQPQLQVIVEKS